MVQDVKFGIVKHRSKVLGLRFFRHRREHLDFGLVWRCH